MLSLILNCSNLKLAVAVYKAGSYIAKFNIPTYLGLYFSFLVFFLILRPKGLRAFYKQLAAITNNTGNFTILLGIL